MIVNKKTPLPYLEDEKRIKEQLNQGPHCGDLWLATGDDLSCYVMIAGIMKADPRLALVVPMDSRLQTGEHGSLTVKETPLGTPMIAWPKYAAIIPVRLLRKPLTGFPNDVVEAIMHQDPSLSENVVPTIEGDDWNKRAHDLNIVALMIWHKMCEDLPDLHQSEGIEFGVDRNREEYFRALKDVLKLSPAECIAVSRGSKKLSAAQSKKMAAAGFAEQPERQEAIPKDYLIMAEQPKWKFLVDAFDGEPESEVRMQLARRAAFTLAARTDGYSEDALSAVFDKVAHDMVGKGDLA